MQDDKKHLTANRLRDVLHYDPAIGDFSWIGLMGDRADIIGRRAGTRSHGYIRIKIDGKKYAAHRLAWLYMTGEWPTKEIDHENRKKDDNRWDNLRDVAHRLNMHNIYAARTDNKIGLRGVYQDRGKFSASICCDGQPKYLGSFETAARAQSAYLEAKTGLIAHSRR